jgi:predicted DNA-binding transcriptional regulator AlpA
MNFHQNQSSEILTKAEAAEFIKVSERSLSRRHAEGKGPPRIKVGRQVRYLKSSLLAWLREQEMKGVRE